MMLADDLHHTLAHDMVGQASEGLGTDHVFHAMLDMLQHLGGQQPSLAHAHALAHVAVDHFLHFMELDPEGKHLALGGDLDGCEELPKGFTGVESYPNLADCLHARGLSEANLYDIYWNNVFGDFALSFDIYAVICATIFNGKLHFTVGGA